MNLLRRQWFALTSGLLCFGWALLGWLTVIPNQDILADGIQAQSVLSDPRVVLSFPGQKHGGPLEYPATLLAEALAPGNYFANAAVRLLLAFATGYVVARLFQTLFDEAPRWSFLVAVAVGPTIMHGLLGPSSNPVGVWWLQPNYDMAWLLVASGALVLACSVGPAGRESVHDPGAWWPLLGGLLLGLGFFAHPVIVLLLVPLVALVVLRSRWRPRAYAITIAGGLIGITPAAISYVVNAQINTWDPSHGAFIAVDYYRSAGAAILGLDGIPDYMTALLPYALGLAPSNTLMSGRLQSTLMWIIVFLIIVTSAVGLARALRSRRPLSPAASIATSWLVAIVMMFAFITFVDPVWIYSSGLGVLFWLSIGALPMFFTIRWIGNVVAATALATVAASTVSHNMELMSDVPDRFQAKIDRMIDEQRLADQLVDAGAQYVFGSYYDVIPVGYASGSRLRTLTNHYNRFPLTDEELKGDNLLVAVNTEPTDPWGHEALAAVKRACVSKDDAMAGSYGLYSCSAHALVFNQ